MFFFENDRGTLIDSHSAKAINLGSYLGTAVLPTKSAGLHVTFLDDEAPFTIHNRNAVALA